MKKLLARIILYKEKVEVMSAFCALLILSYLYTIATDTQFLLSLIFVPFILFVLFMISAIFILTLLWICQTILNLINIKWGKKLKKWAKENDPEWWKRDGAWE